MASETAPAEPAGPSKQNSQNNMADLSLCVSQRIKTLGIISLLYNFYDLSKQYMLPLSFKIEWRQKAEERRDSVTLLHPRDPVGRQLQT